MNQYSKFINRIILVKLVKKITCLIASVISLLTLISEFGRYPYLELSVHFRLQYLWISLICVAVLIALRFWKFALLMMACALFNTSQIIPYYYAPAHEVKDLPANNFKLMLANVEGNNKHYSGLIEAVKFENPDIFVLQEITQKWSENIQVLGSDYPYYKVVPRSGGSGLAIFSRFPVETADILELDTSTHPALFCKINVEGTPLSILTMHPPTPVNPTKFSYRNGQLEKAALIMKTAAEPKILVGDLNTTMWSPYFKDLVRDSGLKDARLGKGLYPSWHSWLPSFLRIPIDHCLVGDKVEVDSIQTGDNTWSDHRPLIMNLRIEKQIIQLNQ